MGFENTGQVKTNIGDLISKRLEYKTVIDSDMYKHLEQECSNYKSKLEEINKIVDCVDVGLSINDTAKIYELSKLSDG